MSTFYKPIALDIETVANAELIELIPIKSPPSNYKDPEKIKEFQRKRRQKEVEAMALDWRFGKIVCIGLCDADKSCVLFDLDEQALLRKFWNTIGSYTFFITFNGMHFDIPFLLFRSMINDVPVSVRIDSHRFRHRNHCDLRLVLENHEPPKQGGLGLYTRLLLGYGKLNGLSGGDVASLFDKKEFNSIMAYCRYDAELIWKLFSKVRPYYFNSL